MKFGNLDFVDVSLDPGLVAPPTDASIKQHGLKNVLVSKIDATLADTAAFCDAYDVSTDESANCVVVEARRGDKTWYAACMILASNKADINGVVRRLLDARKISFAAMDTATTLTQMEYGGITPIGLPADWEIIVDESIMQKSHVIIGSGIRGSKLLIEPSIFGYLPGVVFSDIKKSS
jgi:prolyl-tRNA editing enzyme YbaK/EbsC (Cys-tRNA(Pro) deacylase)